MYESYYGLSERPFDLTPNPRFLLMTQGHREALSTIQYGISGRKGLTLVIGAAGTGKTTLVHAALAREQGGDAKTIHLSNPTLSRDEFFQFLGLELGLPVDGNLSKTRFLRDMHAALLKRHQAGMVTALIVDEAQSMPDELLEELRLLENLETPSERLLPVVLVGQLELADRLKQPGLQALKQRIALRASLAPLTVAETGAYMAERIRIAGGDVRLVFNPEAIAAVAESSGGIPRNISVICDNAMVSGFATDERPIGIGIIAEVCRDFDFAPPTPRVTVVSPAVVPPSVVAPPVVSPPVVSPAVAAAAEPTAGTMAMATARPEPPRVFFPPPPPTPVMSRVEISVSPPLVETLMTEHIHEKVRPSLFARARRRTARMLGLGWLLVRTESR